MASEFEPVVQPEPPKDNTPEAADLIDRAQSGDLDALWQIFKMDKPIFVEDMQGKLAEFDAGKTEGTSGGEGK